MKKIIIIIIKKKTKILVQIHMPEWMKKAQQILIDYFLVISYLTIVIVALFERTSIISVIYLLFLFVCLFIHVEFHNAMYIVPTVWRGSIFIIGGCFLVRYVSQFVQVYNWLESWLFSGKTKESEKEKKRKEKKEREILIINE